MAKKGQKFQKYSMEIKSEDIRLKEAGYSYQQIVDRLNIVGSDKNNGVIEIYRWSL